MSPLKTILWNWTKTNVTYAFQYKHKNVWLQIGHVKIWECKKQKPVIVKIDRTLSLDEYIASLCRKAGKTLSILARTSDFTSTNKKSVLMKTVVQSQFDPMIKTFQSGCSIAAVPTKKINDLLDRSLRLIHKDKISSFEDFIKSENSFTIQQRNIQSLAIGIWRVKEILSNNIAHEIIQTKKTWTWGHNYFTCNCVNTYKIGLNLFGIICF